MHFFSPANVMKLLEVVRGAKTAKRRAGHRHAASPRRSSKTAVVSGVCDGFIGNRMLEQYLRQAMFLLEEGASPQQVDQRAGELRHGDGAVSHERPRGQRRRLVHPQAPLRREAAPSSIRGSPTGCASSAASARRPAWAGTATRPARRDALPDPAVDALIAELPQGARHRRRARSATEEIVERCIYALVNEGARILEEGIALRASDIDVVYLTGYGFPRYRGGPMLYADTVGLYNVVRAHGSRSPPTRTAIRHSGSRRRCSPGSPPKARRSTADSRTCRHDRRSHRFHRAHRARASPGAARST